VFRPVPPGSAPGPASARRGPATLLVSPVRAGAGPESSCLPAPLAAAGRQKLAGTPLHYDGRAGRGGGQGGRKPGWAGRRGCCPPGTAARSPTAVVSPTPGTTGNPDQDHCWRRAAVLPLPDMRLPQRGVSVVRSAWRRLGPHGEHLNRLAGGRPDRPGGSLPSIRQAEGYRYEYIAERGRTVRYSLLGLRDGAAVRGHLRARVTPLRRPRDRTCTTPQQWAPQAGRVLPAGRQSPASAADAPRAGQGRSCTPRSVSWRRPWRTRRPATPARSGWDADGKLVIPPLTAERRPGRGCRAAGRAGGHAGRSRRLPRCWSSWMCAPGSWAASPTPAGKSMTLGRHPVQRNPPENLPI